MFRIFLLIIGFSPPPLQSNRPPPHFHPKLNAPEFSFPSIPVLKPPPKRGCYFASAQSLSFTGAGRFSIMTGSSGRTDVLNLRGNQIQMRSNLVIALCMDSEKLRERNASGSHELWPFHHGAGSYPVGYIAAARGRPVPARRQGCSSRFTHRRKPTTPLSLASWLAMTRRQKPSPWLPESSVFSHIH